MLLLHVCLGASKVSRLIATYLKQHGRYVVLVDNNQDHIRTAKDLGIDAIEANIFNDNLQDNIELSNVGFLIALTANDAINLRAINLFKKQFGENGTYRMVSNSELKSGKKLPEEGLFSKTHDFLNLSEVANRYPGISEIALVDEGHLKSILEITNKDDFIVPLFVRMPSGEIQIISSIDSVLSNYVQGSALAYLGRPIDIEESQTKGQTPILNEG